jgi:hypothetical protein
MKSRRMRWAEHVALMGEKRNVIGIESQRKESTRKTKI